MTTLRTAVQQALAFTMRDFASLRDFEAAKAVLHDNLRAALAQQAEPSQEPVATLIAQRDALLEALIKCRDRFFPADQPERDRDELWEPVTAAIKAAEGEKK